MSANTVFLPLILNLGPMKARKGIGILKRLNKNVQYMQILFFCKYNKLLVIVLIIADQIIRKRKLF